MDGDNLTGFTLENASRHPAARQFGSSAVRQGRCQKHCDHAVKIKYHLPWLSPLEPAAAASASRSLLTHLDTHDLRLAPTHFTFTSHFTMRRGIGEKREQMDPQSLHSAFQVVL